MASYFELFATGLRGCTVRWTRYEDAVTGTELLAACVPIFELANGLSSCDGDGVAAGQWSKLLGVSCVDMNIIVDLPTLEAHAQYPQFKAAYEAATKTCPSIQVVANRQPPKACREGVSRMPLVCLALDGFGVPRAWVLAMVTRARW